MMDKEKRRLLAIYLLTTFDLNGYDISMDVKYKEPDVTELCNSVKEYKPRLVESVTISIVEEKGNDGL